MYNFLLRFLLIVTCSLTIVLNQHNFMDSLKTIKTIDKENLTSFVKQLKNEETLLKSKILRTENECEKITNSCKSRYFDSVCLEKSKKRENLIRKGILSTENSLQESQEVYNQAKINEKKIKQKCKNIKEFYSRSDEKIRRDLKLIELMLNEIKKLKVLIKKQIKSEKLKKIKLMKKLKELKIKLRKINAKEYALRNNKQNKEKISRNTRKLKRKIEAQIKKIEVYLNIRSKKNSKENPKNEKKKKIKKQKKNNQKDLGNLKKMKKNEKKRPKTKTDSKIKDKKSLSKPKNKKNKKIIKKNKEKAVLIKKTEINRKEVKQSKSKKNSDKKEKSKQIKKKEMKNSNKNKKEKKKTNENKPKKQTNFIEIGFSNILNNQIMTLKGPFLIQKKFSNLPITSLLHLHSKLFSLKDPKKKLKFLKDAEIKFRKIPKSLNQTLKQLTGSLTKMKKECTHKTLISVKKRIIVENFLVNSKIENEVLKKHLKVEIVNQNLCKIKKEDFDICDDIHDYCQSFSSDSSTQLIQLNDLINLFNNFIHQYS